MSVFMKQHIYANNMAADIFRCIFLNKDNRIPIQISIKLIAKSPINYKPVFVQVMAWRRTGDKTFHQPIPAQFTDAYMRH